MWSSVFGVWGLGFGVWSFGAGVKMLVYDGVKIVRYEVGGWN